MNSKKKIKEFKFTKTDIVQFCELTKDKNPVHLNKNFLINTKYEDLIVPGMLLMSKINEIISNNYKGAIIVEIISSFREPVYVNQKYKIDYKITKINHGSNFYKLKSLIMKNTKKAIIEILFILPK